MIVLFYMAIFGTVFLIQGIVENAQAIARINAEQKAKEEEQSEK